MPCLYQPDIQDGYICINCGCFLASLYEKYGEFHIRLSLCSNCGMIADKYIEYDNVLLFIDLILLKPTAYRHTIYNVFLAPKREPFTESSSSRKLVNNGSTASDSDSNKYISLSPVVFRLGILMLLFEVYITWAYQEKGYIESEEHTSLIAKLVLGSPIQYSYFLTSTIAQNALLCMFLTYFSMMWLPFDCNNDVFDGTPTPRSSFSLGPGAYPLSFTLQNQSQTSTIRERTQLNNERPTLFSRTSYNSTHKQVSLDYPKNHKPTYIRIFQVIVATVLISNIIKLFPIVMLIWPYDSPILFATRLLVRIVHLLLLIEAIHIVMIDPKGTKRKHTRNILSSSSSTSSPSLAYINAQTVLAPQPIVNDYYVIIFIVLVSDLVRFLISHVIVAFFASAVWGVSVRAIGVDDWRMIKVGFAMLEELGIYLLGKV